MSGSEFLAYVKRIFKRTDKDTEIYEAATDVIMDIKMKYFFEDFKTVSYTTDIDVAGEYKLDLPSNFQHLIGTVVLQDDDGGSRPLTKRTKETFDVMYPYPDESDVVTGKPTDFCIYGGQIYLGSVPDKLTYIYQLNYSTEAATTISASTTSVPFTTYNRWVLRNLVLAEMYDSVDLYDEASIWRSKGNSGLDDMISKEQHNVDALEAVSFSDL